jgi:electron transfer flavoprotein alpha subunit
VSVLCFVESRGGQVPRASREALSKAVAVAKEKGMACIALLAHDDDAAKSVAGYGAAKLLVAHSPALAAYSAEGFAHALTEAAKKTGAQLILGAASAMLKDFFPRAAARLGAGLATDCTELSWKGAVEFVRPVYSGKAYIRGEFTSAPALATLRPNVFADAPAGGESPIERLPVDSPAKVSRAAVKQVVQEKRETPELTTASMVVSGGRGMKEPANLKLVEELAKALGAAQGASRAVVDAGWIPHSFQVGQTGKVVSPKLYVACGISGQIQHLAGMRTSKVIVAINKDPQAPIFKVADYGVVGDALTVVPALAAEIKRMKATGQL